MPSHRCSEPARPCYCLEGQRCMQQIASMHVSPEVSHLQTPQRGCSALILHKVRRGTTCMPLLRPTLTLV